VKTEITFKFEHSERNNPLLSAIDYFLFFLSVVNSLSAYEEKLTADVVATINVFKQKIIELGKSPKWPKTILFFS
jgi:hypothetical protein